ncbi:flavin reductase family protein [Sagittula salina]|uniref:Flavin reductase family protein n=1 Tax=Sagittula salina TaxID=2820268 RepID=A0A940MPD6_9RHOB|nr:flavin reductase family protein [Sagittula salina]MBP0482296.1 flavin reductase family protein [Sagittula salina]
MTEAHVFNPADADPRAFRDALGRFATGVCVVTCATPDGPLGITANSFASVSLDPPLVLWSPARRSYRYPHFRAAKRFAIHVMGHEQSAICQGFARDGAAFAGLDLTHDDHGTPLIEGCLSRFECTQEAAHEAGDHTILVGHVHRVTTRDGAPLLFHAGFYGRLADPD